MVKLRDYQADAVDKLLAGLSQRSNQMYTLPTGGGKTVVGVEVGANWLKCNASSKVVWLTHRIELVHQSEGILRARGIPAERMLVTSPLKMLNAMARGEVAYGGADLLIIDEAHHATARTWAAVIHAFPGAVLGLTATPWRLSIREGFDHLYDGLIEGPTKADLIAEGSIVPTLLKRPPRAKQVIEGRGNNGRGDYSIADTMRQSRLVLVERGIDWLVKWNRLRGPLRTIGYCINVRHAEAVREYAVRRWGIRAATLHSKMPMSQRDTAMRGFASGELDLLLNVAVVTEGNDVPGANCVLMLRPTQSLALWLQMCGRASRPAEGKDAALVLDATTNAIRLGHPDDVHKWTLQARGDREWGDGSGAVRTCAECGTACASSVRVCPDCGFEFGVECERCGWSFGYMHDGMFVVPDLDVDTGACFRCMVSEQDSLFSGEVMNFREFQKAFRKKADGSRTLYDHEMNITYWCRADKYKQGAFVGGVFLSDRAARRYMRKGSYLLSERGVKALFGGGGVYARGKSRRDVQRRLFDAVYRPVARGLAQTLSGIEKGVEMPLFY